MSLSCLNLEGPVGPYKKFLGCSLRCLHHRIVSLGGPLAVFLGSLDLEGPLVLCRNVP